MTDKKKFDDLTDIINDEASHGVRSGSERMGRLLSAVGDPQLRMRSVQVLGTNGKGSVCATLEAIMLAAGMRTAMYTSPHLVSSGERLRIDGHQLPFDTWEQAYARVKQASAADPILSDQRPSFFEVMTAMALIMAADAGAEYAIIEAGVGGRQDATTACPKIGAVFAPVGLDHTKYLGNTIEAIAIEKFAAAREDTPSFFASWSAASDKICEIFVRECRDRGSEPMLLPSEDRPSEIKCDLSGTTFSLPGMPGLHTPLIGAHQADNAALTIRAAQKIFGLSDDVIRRGLEAVHWDGRFQPYEIEGGKIVLDGAHNPHGVGSLIKTIADLGDAGIPTGAIVYGAMQDKDVIGSLKLLGELGMPIFCTRPVYSRGMPARDLRSIADSLNIETAGDFEDPTEAMRAARRSVPSDELVICCGSLYLVGDLMEHLLAKI